MNRQVRRGGRQTPRGRRVPAQKSPAQRTQTLTFSDYDTDSDDNIKTVPTARNPNNTSDMVSDPMSDSDSGAKRPEAKLVAIKSDSEYEYYSDKEAEPKARPKPKAKPKPEKSDSDEYSDEIVVNTARSPKSAIHCEPVEEPAIKPHPPPSPKVVRRPEPAEEPAQPEETAEQPEAAAPAEEEPDSGELHHFSVFREQKMFSALRSNELRLVVDGQVILYSQETKDNLGKVHIITSKRMATTDPGSGFEGSVRVNDGSERFTVVSNEEKPNDDREGELAGIEIAGKTKDKGRSMGIVLTSNKQPYFAISKSRGLASMACSALKENKPVQPRFRFYTPKSLTCGADGSIHIEDRDVTALETFKNCVIQDDSGSVLFALYKIADGCYGMKCRAPFTPFIAFGLSIAMMTSNK